MLKPQDILVLAKLLLVGMPSSLRILDMAQSLDISASEVHAALKRLSKSRLIDLKTKKPFKHAVKEFLFFGFKYVFPPEFGPTEIGIPTAHSAFPLSEEFESAEPVVWASLKGKIRGQQIMPLYKSVPSASLRDPELYSILALLDALRIGKAREMEFAKKKLESILFK